LADPNNDFDQRTWASLAQFASTMLVSLGVAFTFNFLAALVVVACAPLVVVAGSMLVTVNSTAEAVTQEAYAKAGATALEVLGSIRTVLSFNGLDIMRARSPPYPHLL
jgi:ATP-binding cassette subfamily B (MDR/TAP) protein 1